MNFDNKAINNKLIENKNFKKYKNKIKMYKLNYSYKNSLGFYFNNFINNNFDNVKSLDSFYRKNFKKDLYYIVFGSDFFYNEINEIIENKKVNKSLKNKFLKNRILFYQILSK